MLKPRPHYPHEEEQPYIEGYEVPKMYPRRMPPAMAPFSDVQPAPSPATTTTSTDAPPDYSCDIRHIKYLLIVVAALLLILLIFKR